ncbi:hypothetical protein FN846DRAFT_950712 [Sphaerosporella brunnea]|uniref:Uncharacterized protein n=1 Tax=Sphaerosporella brunnea TaxID=1250544 RepID=A0A5J5EVH7_9PEZI|nr:hypothetical protein FN846DRAFT_950712 [Sphaerosporella brunnea]
MGLGFFSKRGGGGDDRRGRKGKVWKCFKRLFGRKPKKEAAVVVVARKGQAVESICDDGNNIDGNGGSGNIPEAPANSGVARRAPTSSVDGLIPANSLRSSDFDTLVPTLALPAVTLASSSLPGYGDATTNEDEARAAAVELDASQEVSLFPGQDRPDADTPGCGPSDVAMIDEVMPDGSLAIAQVLEAGVSESGDAEVEGSGPSAEHDEAKPQSDVSETGDTFAKEIKLEAGSEQFDGNASIELVSPVTARSAGSLAELATDEANLENDTEQSPAGIANHPTAPAEKEDKDDHDTIHETSTLPDVTDASQDTNGNKAPLEASSPSSLRRSSTMPGAWIW